MPTCKASCSKHDACTNVMLAEVCCITFNHKIHCKIRAQDLTVPAASSSALQESSHPMYTVQPFDEAAGKVIFDGLPNVTHHGNR